MVRFLLYKIDQNKKITGETQLRKIIKGEIIFKKHDLHCKLLL